MIESEMTDVRKGGRKSVSASNDIMVTLRNIQRRLDGFFGSPLDRPVYSGEDLCVMMGVSATTLKTWRSRGIIGYSRVGSKFFYSRGDIEKFLRSNHFDDYASDSVGFDASSL